MSTFGSTPTSTTAKGSSIAPNDCNVPQPGNDGISSLCWSPTANILVSGNWDAGVRAWEVQEQGGRVQAAPKAQSEWLDGRVVVLVIFSFAVEYSLD